MLSAGGALGGLFVALAAPLLFDRYIELPLAIIACVLLAMALLYRLPRRRLIRLGALSLVAFVAATQAGNYVYGDRLRVRNFYGALHITDKGTGATALRTLLNGAINHGSQFLAPEKARVASTYYGPQSGAALAINFPHTRPRRVGVVGLGAGTLAAYGERGDTYRFYELNPAVITLAYSEFHYLRDCPCGVTVVPGDGRLALEREPPQDFDVLIVDAFNGDSIPVHLLTRQAFDAYMKHLRPGGILAMHVTNRYLDLTPVVKVPGRRTPSGIAPRRQSRRPRQQYLRGHLGPVHRRPGIPRRHGTQDSALPALAPPAPVDRRLQRSLPGAEVGRGPPPTAPVRHKKIRYPA